MSTFFKLLEERPDEMFSVTYQKKANYTRTRIKTRAYWGKQECVLETQREYIDQEYI